MAQFHSLCQNIKIYFSILFVMNYKLKLFLAICFCFLANYFVFSQKEACTPLSNLIDKVASTERWFQMKEPLKVSPNEFLNTYRSELGLTAKGDFRFVRKTQSAGGAAVYHSYQQYHQNVKVEAAVLVFHVYEDAIRAVNGDIVKDLDLDVSNIISKSDAESSALKSLGMGKILVFEGLDSLRKPEIELLIVPIDYTKPLLVENYACVYRVPIQIGKVEYKMVDVDAHNSLIVHSKGDRDATCYPGTVATPYNGTQTLITNQTWEPFWTHYRLNTNCNGYKVETVHSANGTPPFANWKDGDNVWTESGATAHWILQKSWDYFVTDHGIEFTAPDAFGTPIALTVTAIHEPFNPNFPFASSTSSFNGNPTIFFEDARSSWSLGNTFAVTTNSPLSLDIIGHEFTHLVVHVNGNLLSTSGTEGQALFEGFGDIFGNIIQADVVGVNVNSMWKTGEDMSANSVVVRMMSNPNIRGVHKNVANGPFVLGMPDVYQQPNYWDVNSDGHANMGVLLNWFYLLANGGTHRNGSVVAGIGLSKAENITFNMMMALSANGNYTDAKNISINFAKNTYGYCSFEHVQTIKAWNAVGVGNTAIPPQSISATITGLSTLCSNGTSTYTAAYYSNATYSWGPLGIGLQLVSSSGNTAVIKRLAGSTNTTSIGLTVTTPCATASSTKSISYSSSSTPASPQLVGANTICQLYEETINVSNPVAGNTYSWYKTPANFIVGLSPSGSSCDVTGGSSTGTFTLNATAQNGCGLTSSVGTKQIAVLAASNPQCSPIRAGLFKEENTIYPNPVEQKLYFHTTTAKRVVIQDLVGNMIIDITIDKNITNPYIDLSQLSQGSYLFEFWDDNNVLSNHKFVKL